MSGWGSPFAIAAGAVSQIWPFNTTTRWVGLQSPRQRRNSTDRECMVCRSDSTEVEFSTSSPTSVCGHPPEVCISCLQQVILTAITTGDFISGILCPSLDCSQRLDYYDVQKWATSEVFDRYDMLLLQDSLRGDEHYVLCLEPSCTAGQEHAGGETNNIVTCHYCGTKQCFRHQVLWHEGLTCEQWDEHQRIITNQQELMTDEWIQTGTKPCPGPGCGRRIQKDEGCDHMTCRRPAGCGHQFCWECFAPWLQIITMDNSRHYDHCRYYSGLPGNNPAPTERVAAPNAHEPSHRSATGLMYNRALDLPAPPILQAHLPRLDERVDEMVREFARLEGNVNPRLATLPDMEPRDIALRPLRLLEGRPENPGPPGALARAPAPPGYYNYERVIPVDIPDRLLGTETLHRPMDPYVAPIRAQAVAGPGPMTQSRRDNMGHRLQSFGAPVSAEVSHAEPPGSDNQPEQHRIERVPNWAGGFAEHDPPRLQAPPLVPSTYVPPHRRRYWANAPTRPRERTLVYGPGNLALSIPPREAYIPPHLRGGAASPSSSPLQGADRPPNPRRTAYIPPHLREPPQPVATHRPPRW